MIDDPPLGLCPVHPDKKAWRVCLRCGRFLCATCTHPTREGPLCTECVALIPPVVPRIGGWLVLPLISLFANLVMAAMTFESNRDVSFADADPGWVAYWLWYVTPSVVTAILSLIAIPLFLMRKRIVPRLMMGIYGFALASHLIDFIVEQFVPAEWVPAQLNPLTQMVGPLVWLLYFQVSDRVKRTFVR